MAKQLLLERNWCSQLVSLTRVARGGRTKSMPGNLEEIGERSALVLTDSPIANETKVAIACSDHVLTGVTKSCTHDHTLGYFIEVQFTRASNWSPHWFLPRHLVWLSKTRLRFSA